MFCHYMEEAQCLKQRIAEMDEELAGLPEGKFCSVKNGSGTKWYYYQGGKRHYIPKSNKRLAQQLARRKYLTEKLRQCRGQLQAIEEYFTRTIKIRSADELLQNPAYQDLLLPYFQIQNKSLADWAYAPYARNPYRPESCNHLVYADLWVRSKSESMIASFLYQNRIPFRYECALKLTKKIIYPDFTLRHPQTGEYYYIEHFGLFDSQEYRRHALSRMDDYAANGIYLNQQLFVTTETKEKPFSVNQLIPQLQAAAIL
ncbi:MAG: hypothetical protein IKV74_05395 [Clostridia bacterium]|nr:hypothetical protein [Clostridia bacterium]